MKFLKIILACVLSFSFSSVALASVNQPIKNEYGAQLTTLIDNKTFVNIGDAKEFAVSLSPDFIGVPNKFADYEDEIRSVVVKYAYKRGNDVIPKNSTLFMFNLVNCDTKSMITAGLVMFDAKKVLTLADSLDKPTWVTSTPNSADRHIINVVCNA